jgi:adenylate kinase
LKPKNDNICDECGSELVQRDDDKPETVRDRYEVYIKNTKSVVEFYKSQGKLKTFDGSKDIGELASSITDYLESL